MAVKPLYALHLCSEQQSQAYCETYAADGGRESYCQPYQWHLLTGLCTYYHTSQFKFQNLDYDIFKKKKTFQVIILQLPQIVIKYLS